MRVLRYGNLSKCVLVLIAFWSGKTAHAFLLLSYRILDAQDAQLALANYMIGADSLAIRIIPEPIYKCPTPQQGFLLRSKSGI